MLLEYALEPGLLDSYENCRYFLEKFGISQGRLIAQFPRRWLRQIYEALARERAAGRCSELQYARIETMLANIRAALVRRRCEGYRAEDLWLVNAENEHLVRPFQAVVAGDNPRNRDFVVIGRELDETNPLWQVARGVVIDRTPVQIAGVVRPLLKISETLVFVDRHFGPENARHRQVFQALMAACVTERERDPRTVVVFTGTNATNEFFLQTCRDELPRITPAGMPVRLVKLTERVGGEKLHNRYVLTERGGISLGTGLDTGRAGETDDANLLAPNQHVRRWNDYMGVVPSFDTACDVTIIGTAAR